MDSKNKVIMQTLCPVSWEHITEAQQCLQGNKIVGHELDQKQLKIRKQNALI